MLSKSAGLHMFKHVVIPVHALIMCTCVVCSAYHILYHPYTCT